MEDRLLALFRGLWRCRDRFAETTAQLPIDDQARETQPVDIPEAYTAVNQQHPIPASGLELDGLVRRQLDLTQRAVEALPLALAASESQQPDGRVSAAYADALIAKASEAMTSLAVAVDVLLTAESGPHLCTNTAIVEARSLMTHIAQSLARHQQHQALQAAAATRAAVAAGDPDAARSAAIQAEEAAATAMLAGCLSGLDVIRQARAAQRAAAEAMDMVETTAWPLPASAAAPVDDFQPPAQAAEAPDTACHVAQTAALSAEEAAVADSGPATATAAPPAALHGPGVASMAAARASASPGTDSSATAPATASSGAESAPPNSLAAAMSGWGDAAAVAESSVAITAALAAAASGAGDSSSAAAAAVADGAHNERVWGQQEDTGGSGDSSSNSGSDKQPGPAGPTSLTGPTLSTQPQQPPHAPSGDADIAVQSALSYLAGLAGELTADGRLLAETLSRAAGACEAVRGLPDGEWASVSASAWGCRQARCGLIRLLSSVLRELLEALPSEGAVQRAACCTVMHVLFKSLGLGAFGRIGTGPVGELAMVEQVVRLLVRTDVVQCLARLLAATTQTAEAATALAEAEMETAAAASAAAADCTQPEGDSMDNTLVIALMHTVPICFYVRDHAGLQGAMHQLRSTMLRSRLLEHAARAAVQLVRQSAAPGGVTAASSRSDVDDEAAALQAHVAEMHVGMVSSTLDGVLALTVLGDRPRVVWADAVLSGSCVQFFLLLHVVSQLCAADRGPDYGLPAGLRFASGMLLPSIGALLPLGSCGSGSGGASSSDESRGWPSVGPRHLSAALMARVFAWWSRKKRARPCSDRALRALCERAAAAAISSVAAGEADAAAATAAAAASSEGRAMQRYFSPPEDAATMALAAMYCAVSRMRRGSEGDFPRLCAPVVQTANTAARVRRQRTGVFGGLTPLQLLVALTLPPFEPGAVLMPPQPGPNLEAVLAAGYVPALERAIRNEARLAGSSAAQLAPVLRGVQKLLTNSSGLAGLMAYGEPTQVAALLATVVKVAAMANTPMEMGPEHTLEVLFMILNAAARGLNKSDGVGFRPKDGLWWLPGSALPGSAASSAEGSSAGEREPSSAAGGASGGGATGSPDGRSGGEDGNRQGDACGSRTGSGAGLLPPTAPVQRLSLLATFTATLCLPALLGSPGPGGVKGLILPFWLTALLQAYQCCNGSTSSSSGSSTIRGAASSSGGGAGAGGSAAHHGLGGCLRSGAPASEGGLLVAAAASWERLLVRELDLPGKLVRRCQSCYRESDRLDVRSEAFESLAELLLHLLVACPQHGREVLRTQMGTGRSSTTLLDWLRKTLLAADGDLSSTSRHFLELAPAVAAGREPGAEDLARLRSDFGLDWTAAGPLLPPPCFVAEVLQLPLCANPGCTNLEGDSEAGLRRVACKGCSNVSYCSRDCRAAHWRAGHKTECASAAASGSRGRGG